MPDTENTQPQILYTPEDRKALQARKLEKDGMQYVREDPDIGYGIMPLTGLGTNISAINEQIKSYIHERQRLLQNAMAHAGIDLYDPASAPYSPDIDLSAGPQQVYQTDSLRVAMARHVTFLDLLPTTGGGEELEKARDSGKFVHIIHDPGIRTSRMQPHGVLHLAIDDMAERQHELTAIFAFVHQFEPCIGLQDGVPAMMGWHSATNSYVNLEREVARYWPDLIYRYNAEVPIIQVSVLNPEIFDKN